MAEKIIATLSKHKFGTDFNITKTKKYEDVGLWIPQKLSEEDIQEFIDQFEHWKKLHEFNKKMEEESKDV